MFTIDVRVHCRRGGAITEMVTGDGSGVELRMLQEEEMCLEEKWESQIANTRYWFYRSDLLEPALRVLRRQDKKREGKKRQTRFHAAGIVSQSSEFFR